LQKTQRAQKYTIFAPFVVSMKIQATIDDELSTDRLASPNPLYGRKQAAIALGYD